MPRCRAIVVCGNAATGKTTYATRLAQQEQALLLDIDRVSERLVKIGLEGYGLDPNDRDSPEYKRLFRAAIHDTLFDLAADNLPHVPCVIVAPFTQERRQGSWRSELEARLGTRVRILYLACSDEERLRRLKARGNPRDSLKLANFDDYAALGRDEGRPPFEHEWIDTTEWPAPLLGGGD